MTNDNSADPPNQDKVAGSDKLYSLDPRIESLSKEQRFAEIKMLYTCSAKSSKELSEMYGVSDSAIRKRAERGSWPTPKNLRKKVEMGEEYVPPQPKDEPKDVIKFVREGELTDSAMNAEILRRWTKRADEAREDLHQILTTLVSNFDANETIVDNVRDLKTVVDMYRENLNLNDEKNSGSSANKPLVSLQVLGGSNSPVIKPIDV